MVKSIIAIALLLILISSSTISGQPGNPTMYYGAAYIVQYINTPGCIPPTCILTGTGNAPHYMPVLACCIDSTLPFYNGSEIVILKQKVNTASKNSDSAYVQLYDSVGHCNLGKLSTIKHIMFLVTDTSQIYNDSALVAYYLDSANAINQSIVPVLVVEINKKAVNNLYINKIVKNIFNFSNNEKQGIHNIAGQCPFSGGIAVIEARTIERQLNDTIFYNNNLLCQQAIQISQKHSKDKIGKEQVELNVYPNPTNNSFKIQSNVNGLVSIKDMTGRKIFEATFTSPLKEINVSGILPGVYFLTLEVNTTVVANKQIVFIK